MSIAVKICGLTDPASVAAAVSAGTRYVGFVFYPASPRHISVAQAAALKATLPTSVASVSVLVDPDDALLASIERELRPDYLQLHGKETPERLKQIRTLCPSSKIIKALSVRTGDDIAQAGRYIEACDMLLFDAKPPQLAGMLPGGNGLSFDWTLLNNRTFARPWFLSGGLNGENVADAIRHSGATMVDVSSGVEQSPGVKDAQLITQFIAAAHAP
ncbi:MAG: phosphoribosylanthranilate isomerase [Rickettsiales bacterium]|nr:phosphoribosylanthranilate isomerase [Rickettsiales bacterium]